MYEKYVRYPSRHFSFLLERTLIDRIFTKLFFSIRLNLVHDLLSYKCLTRTIQMFNQ